MSLLNEIEPLKQSALAELKAAPDLAALEQTKGAWIGPNGKFTALMKQLGTLPKEEKPAAGKLINAAKVELDTALVSRREELELKAALPKEPTDFTLPGRRRTLGKLHPLTQVTDDIVRAFRKIGFVVADGPEIEDDYHCFDSLNTPADHPARDAQDTFYVGAAASPSPGGEGRGEGGPQPVKPYLLRTHTSSVQIRVMKSQPPPIRIIASLGQRPRSRSNRASRAEGPRHGSSHLSMILARAFCPDVFFTRSSLGRWPRLAWSALLALHRRPMGLLCSPQPDREGIVSGIIFACLASVSLSTICSGDTP